MYRTILTKLLHTEQNEKKEKRNDFFYAYCAVPKTILTKYPWIYLVIALSFLLFQHLNCTIAKEAFMLT